MLIQNTATTGSRVHIAPASAKPNTVPVISTVCRTVVSGFPRFESSCGRA
jgi:hypothetical protein